MFRTFPCKPKSFYTPGEIKHFLLHSFFCKLDCFVKDCTVRKSNKKWKIKLFMTADTWGLHVQRLHQTNFKISPLNTQSIWKQGYFAIFKTISTKWKPSWWRNLISLWPETYQKRFRFHSFSICNDEVAWGIRAKTTTAKEQNDNAAPDPSVLLYLQLEL